MLNALIFSSLKEKPTIPFLMNKYFELGTMHVEHRWLTWPHEKDHILKSFVWHISLSHINTSGCIFKKGNKSHSLHYYFYHFTFTLIWLRRWRGLLEKIFKKPFNQVLVTVSTNQIKPIQPFQPIFLGVLLNS